MAKSPSVTILERDMSTFTVTNSETVLAVVGYATKGPIGKATFIISRAQFNEVFGDPAKESPFSALAVYRAFNQGNQIIYFRIADDTATGAEVAITNPIPATKAKVYLDITNDPFTGFDPSTEYAFKIAIDGGAQKTVKITSNSSGVITKSDLIAAISTTIDRLGTVNFITAENKIVIETDTAGTAGSVSVTDDTFFAATTDITIGSVEAGVDAITNTTDNILFKAKEKGSSTNKIAIQKSSKINPLTLKTVHTIKVLYDGVVKETFDDISLKIGDPNFFATVMNAEPENGGSKWVTVEYEDNDSSDPTNKVITFPDNPEGEFYALGKGTVEYSVGKTIGQYDYRVGTDGIPTSVNDQVSLFLAALNPEGDLGNSELYDYHILITPDLPIPQVQDAALALANYRKDFIYIVDAPFGFTAENIADWHNGRKTPRTVSLNSSYGALYWPWLKDYNPISKEYIWCPPSVFIAEKYMEIDRNYGPWYAPAGDSRGRINAFDYETSPSFAQRELIYGDLNAVNPIVNFSSKGLLVYGQKTLLRENSALNRVNVRRMVVYIKKLVKKAMDSMLFEPHNPESWKKAAAKISSILEPIKQSNGLDQYRVVIDGTTNTPDLIAQSIMKGIIKIVPTGTIEVIELTLQVNKAGSTLEE